MDEGFEERRHDTATGQREQVPATPAFKEDEEQICYRHILHLNQKFEESFAFYRTFEMLQL